jgi:O-antigen ligase
MASLKVQNFLRLLFTDDNQYSYMTRIAAARVMTEIIKINPVIGLGPANYYWYTPLFPILGYAVQFNSHNNYIDIIAQTGLLGLACFLWFAWEVWRLGWRLRSIVPEGFARAYVYGALGGLVATMAAGMLGDWVLPFIYNVGYDGFRSSVLGWLFLGGLMALEQIYVHNGANPTVEER